MVIVTDDDIDARRWPEVIWALATRMDPARDTLILENTAIDYLDFASPVAGLGGKIGFDATHKWPGETTRRWGRPIAMDPQVAQGIQTAADSQVTQFVRVVAERQMLVQAAEEAGTELTAEDWRYLSATHDSALRTLYTVAGLDPVGLRDSAATPDAMRRLAMARVNDLPRPGAGRPGTVLPHTACFGDRTRVETIQEIELAAS